MFTCQTQTILYHVKGEYHKRFRGKLQTDAPLQPSLG